MTITITISTDNAAFEDSPSWEVIRILRELADKLLMSNSSNLPKLLWLRDVNGNVVGQFVTKEG